MKFLSTIALSMLAVSGLAAQTPKPAAPAKPAPVTKPAAAAAAAPAAAPQPPAAPKAKAPTKETKPEAKATTRRADGTTATVDQIKDAQKLLADKGLYKGAVTGRLNKDFKAALTAYQKQNNLKATGRLNQETIAKMHQG
jgi:peptidoglycan hydrolase-like protein with peptidoglycan-binding domain